MVLDFDFQRVTLQNILGAYQNLLSKLFGEQVVSQVVEMANYLLLLCAQDLKLISNFKKSDLVQAVLFASIRIIKDYNQAKGQLTEDLKFKLHSITQALIKEEDRKWGGFEELELLITKV